MSYKELARLVNSNEDFEGTGVIDSRTYLGCVIRTRKDEVGIRFKTVEVAENDLMRLMDEQKNDHNKTELKKLINELQLYTLQHARSGQLLKEIREILNQKGE